MSIISVAEKINYNSMHNLMSLFCKTFKPNQTLKTLWLVQSIIGDKWYQGLLDLAKIHETPLVPNGI